MATTDPAVEAAKRVEDRDPIYPALSPLGAMVETAREAHAPIKEVLQHWELLAAQGVSLPMRDVLARLKPLVYTSEELQ